MRDVKSYVAVLCAVLLLAPASFAQQQDPQIGSENAHWHSGLTRNYTATYIPPIDITNSSRMDSLIQQGNLYLSLNDAIAMALENNIDVESQRYIFDIRGYALKNAQAGACGGSCDPSLQTNWSWQHSAQIQQNAVTAGGQAINVGNTKTKNYTLSQNLGTGTQLSLSFNNRNSTTNNRNQTYVPGYNSGLQLNATQPLLQGFGKAFLRRSITIANNDIRRADSDFQQTVNTTLNTVIQAYWNLVSARSQVDVNQKTVELNQQLYENNQKQVDIGTLAPLDVLTAETQVAAAQAQLVQSQTQVLTQENTLKNLLSRNGLGNPLLAGIHIIPTDRIRVPDVEPVTPLQDLVAMALQKRPEPTVLQLTMEDTRQNLLGTKNSLLPQLNLTANISNPGVGGVLNPLQNVDPVTGMTVATRNPPPAGLIGGYSNILRQLFSVPTLNYQVGFTFTVTLRNRAAQAQLAQQTLQLRQNELALQKQVNQIRLDVQNAQVAVTQARAQYVNATKARELQEQVLSAEQQKYELGVSTVYTIVQYQRDLATNRRNEVAAQVAYAQAKLQMDMATGNLMDRYNIVFNEARDGQISRRADPIPPTLTNPPQGQAAVPGLPQPITPR